MLNVGSKIIDKYNRTFLIVEAVNKTGENGKNYILYNLYPPDKKPKRRQADGSPGGLYYEPYLYVTDDVLKIIIKSCEDAKK